MYASDSTKCWTNVKIEKIYNKEAPEVLWIHPSESGSKREEKRRILAVDRYIGMDTKEIGTGLTW